MGDGMVFIKEMVRAQSKPKYAKCAETRKEIKHLSFPDPQIELRDPEIETTQFPCQVGEGARRVSGNNKLLKKYSSIEKNSSGCRLFIFRFSTLAIALGSQFFPIQSCCNIKKNLTCILKQ